MQTVMDYSFPDAASLTPWYYSVDTNPVTQLKTPNLGNWNGESYADIIISPDTSEYRLWWDMNHVHFGPVNLLFVSWFQLPVGGGGGGAGRAWPSLPSLVDAEVTFQVRAYDFYLPGTARIGLWYQAKVPDVNASGPVLECYGNYFQKVDLCDDVMGFGGRGLARPKTTFGVRGLSDWRDWTVRMSPDDDMWQSMGSRLSKTGISYQPQGPFSYGCAKSIRDMLESPIKFNMGIMVVWAPTPDLYTPPNPTVPIFGRLQVKNVKVKIPD